MRETQRNQFGHHLQRQRDRRAMFRQREQRQREQDRTTLQRAELFLISLEVIEAADVSEVNATYADMEELGIAHMPYGLVDLDINASVFRDEVLNELQLICHSELVDKTKLAESLRCKVRFRYRDDKCYDILVGFDDGEWCELHSGGFHHQCTEYREKGELFKKLLVVVLATKEIVKTRTKDKLLAMGIGKGKRDNHRPIYTTTISLPIKTVLTSELPAASPRAGISPRPHLRRGHPRRQRHGPHGEFVKKIWVPPCFVNADESYVSTRFSYNTGLRHEGIPGRERSPDAE